MDFKTVSEMSLMLVDSMSEKNEEESFTPLPFIMGGEASEEEIRELETKLSSLMRVITEDARQLSEHLAAEENAVREVCRYLERILSKLNLSVSIPGDAVPSMKKYREVILNPECHLILIDKDNSVESRSLSKYPPETILAVVWALIPKLREEVSAYLRKVSVRLGFLEVVKEELSNIQKPFTHSERDSIGEFEEDKAKEIFIRR